MSATRGLALGAISLLLACGGGQQAALRPDATGQMARSVGKGRPPLAAVVRDGDAGGGVAVAVSSEGIAGERGAVAGVSLAALVEARLAAKGVPVEAIGGWGGWRLRALVAAAADAKGVVSAVRDAMLAPVAAGEPALEAVRRKVDALGRRPLADRALVEVARCTGEPFGLGADPGPTAAELEAWRAAAHGTGRIAFGVAGSAAVVQATGDALAATPVWPVAAAGAPAAWPSGEEPVGVYDASGEIAPGAARVVVTAWTGTPERAIAAASGLGEARGALASRLAALDAPARIGSVVATAHPEGGCVAASIDMGARDLGGDVPARIATAAALARQEVAVEMADTSASADLGQRLALNATDPREAAERAAWWSLAGHTPGHERDAHVALFVGVAVPRDAAPGAAAPAAEIRAAIDRATLAWHAPVVEARVRVEHGQGETWVLLASPCGTLPESAADAGSGAAVATAAAIESNAAGDARAEPFVATDAVGVLAHGPAHPGESPAAQARRIGDLAARALAGEALDPGATTRARTALLGRAGGPRRTRARCARGSRVAGSSVVGGPAGDGDGHRVGLRRGPGAAGCSHPLRPAARRGARERRRDAVRRRRARRRPLDRTEAGRGARMPERADARRPPRRDVRRAAAGGSDAGSTPRRPPTAGRRRRPRGRDVDGRSPERQRRPARARPRRPVGRRGVGARERVERRRPGRSARSGARDPRLRRRRVARRRGRSGPRAARSAPPGRDARGGPARAPRRPWRVRLSRRRSTRARAPSTSGGAPRPPPAPSLEALRAFAASTLHDEALVIVAARVPRPPPPAPKDKKAGK